MALQIVQCKSSSWLDFENTFQLKHENISNVLNQVGERPICILSICGPPNLGKSLLLNYIIRCLEATERGVDEWIDKANPEKVPKGFQWTRETPVYTTHQGASSYNYDDDSDEDEITTTTKGICLYKRPFILKNCRGKEYAVILMDTQGIYYDDSSHSENKAIIGLCMLLSSVTILNLPIDSGKITEVFKSLKVYCDYGNLATNEYLGKPYGKLQFLFRDWNESVKYPLGEIGGRAYLKNMKQQKDIRNYLTDMDSFLLPKILTKGSQKKCFDGSLASLDKSFGCKMQEYISNLVENDLRPAKICGNLLTAKDLRLYLYGYIECFNQRNFPTANTLFVTTQGIEIIKNCLKHHTKFYKDFETGPRYLTATSFLSAQKEAEKQAMKLYEDSMKSMNSQKLDQHDHLRKLLESEMKRESESLKIKNDKKRGKALMGAQAASMNTFKLRFEQEYIRMVISSSCFAQFKNVVVARQHANEVKQLAFNDFLNNLCGNETEDEIQNFWRPVRIQFDEIIDSIIEQISLKEQRLARSKGLKRQQTRFTMSMGNLSNSRDDDEPSCLNCPICFEVHQGKVFQCNNGHVICEKCSTSVKNCPQCRIPISGKSKIRNRALEEIIEKLQLGQK